MLLATDVYYDDVKGEAVAAGIVFPNWRASKALKEYTVKVSPILPYESGSFYKRELPCLSALLFAVSEKVTAIIVDSYVDIGPGRPGLGRRLYDSLDGNVPVIGVAKTHFLGSENVQVLRGQSESPLFVTAAGMDLDEAAAHVRSMHGPYRFPTLLKRVDTLCRSR